MNDRNRSFAARPTVYKGIQMRSRLEASFAAGLDRAMYRSPELFGPGGWQYEQTCFASDRGQYLPDFAYTLVGPNGALTKTYVEVKPVIYNDDQWRAVTDRMAIIWDSEPDAVLTLAEFGDESQRRHWSGVRYETADGSAYPWWMLTSPERAVA